jgi:hypothetical protein
MTIKVRVRKKLFNVKSKLPLGNIKVVTKSGIIMARKLSDLQDVDIDSTLDKYVLMFNENTQKYESVNPDEIFSAAALTETTQPGLPEDFLEYLRSNLQLDSSNQILEAILDKLSNLRLSDLVDTDVDDARDRYTLMYNELLDKWRAENPDNILSAAVQEPENPGLPEVFIDQLDTDLDNRIDFDGGDY